MVDEIEMNRPTWVEINLESIKNNFEAIKNLTPTGRVICVVKADAYGLGAKEIARELEKHFGFCLRRCLNGRSP